MFEKIRFWLKKRGWRKRNAHNSTIMKNNFSIDRVTVGKETYGPISVTLMAEDTNINIGNYCSIGPDVIFMGGGEHDYKRLSTYPFQTKVYREATKKEINRNIVIEDDVWIGYDSLIMPGVTVGKGSVIGARSIVTKDVPPYSVYVGCKVIKKRFSDSLIKRIQTIDFASIEHHQNDLYEKYCQSEIDDDNIEQIMACFNNVKRQE
ncbi:MAG: CatB-related O-acetyltransferase [Lachnospiraceae bacterium]